MDRGISVFSINKKFIFFTLLIFTVISGLSAVNFSNLNLSADDRLLFRTDFEGQSAVFLARLSNMSMQQITAFPEKMYIIDSGRTILALNKFGAVKIPVSGGLPVPLAGYPSFSRYNVPLKGRVQDIAASADGRWYLHIEPVSYGYGNLFLINIASGAQKLVSERVELPGLSFPVKWSPDSRLFVYSKGGTLYYFPIIEDLSALVDERFRIIGEGGINSVLWGLQGDFYYLSGNILYRVINPELFTRSIYGDFLSIGDVSAVLPFNFDSGFDQFWVAPDSGSILVNKGTRGLFFFLMGENSDPSQLALPHIPIPYGAENINVLWPLTGNPAISYSLRNRTTVLLFETARNSIRQITAGAAPSSPNCALSPDGTKALFWGESGLEIWDYTNWRLIQRLLTNPVYSCSWINNRQFIAGNSSFIEEISITASIFTRRRIALSSADEFGFEEGQGLSPRILARSGNLWFANDGTGAWVSAANVQLRPVSLSSNTYRVFLEPQLSGHFSNTILIRNLQSTVTSFFTSRFTESSIFVFRQPEKIALCFDLYDDYTGLPIVLEALRRLNIRATFFLNGEFIRRYPQAAASIAQAGHEAASMFYAPVDFSDTRYRLTHDFIIQGLARNEDEFHRATEMELSMIWHPPFYRVSALVSSAAAANGYITVERTLDPNDWLSKEESLKLNMRQIPPAEIIEQVMRNVRGDAVIPVRLGLLSGGRDEYLFQRMDVLLDALIRSGYEIVPVSSVVRR